MNMLAKLTDQYLLYWDKRLPSQYQTTDKHIPLHAKQLKKNINLWLILVVLLSIFFQSNTALAADFGTPQLSCYLSDEYFLFDADIDYAFSNVAIEALENGVSLIIQLDIKLVRHHSWIWETSLIEQHPRFQIKYHHLSSLYWVTNLDTQVSEDFVTLSAAITALGTLTDMPIIHQSKLAQKQIYQLQLSAKLDVDVLPLPLRPFAFINPSWHLSSNTGLCEISL